MYTIISVVNLSRHLFQIEEKIITSHNVAYEILIENVALIKELKQPLVLLKYILKEKNGYHSSSFVELFKLFKCLKSQSQVNRCVFNMVYNRYLFVFRVATRVQCDGVPPTVNS